MTKQGYSIFIKRYINEEVSLASELLQEGNTEKAFHHLERAHVLGQSITYEHTRVHWLMLKAGWQTKNWREVFGQMFRIVAASTKTPFGIYPTGNTGGANVSPFKPMLIPDDLQKLIVKAKSG